MQNKKIVEKEGLIRTLQEVDAQIQEPAPLTAIGGTALTLLGLKDASWDIDFILEKKDPVLKAAVTVEFWNRGYDIQIQEKGLIVVTVLPKDYQKRSLEDEEISQKLRNIKLRILSPLDIILTKLARFDTKDKKDIAGILEKFNFTFDVIERRFQQYHRIYKGGKKEYAEKFEEFRKFYSELLR